MPSETDAKTRLGLSQALTKANQIHGTLGAIDPDSDNPDATSALRRSRGLAAALVVAIQHLETTCYDLWQARPPRQLSIDDLLSSARKLVPSLREEDSGTVRAAAELEPERPARKPAKPEQEPGAVVRGFFGTDEAAPSIEEVDQVAEALAEAGRPRPSSVVEAWSDEERAAALAWAESADRDDLPPPEHVTERVLEDLDVDVDEDLEELLGWLGIRDAASASWTPEERAAIVAWAADAYLVDRHGGRFHGAAVVPLPDVLAPDAETFAVIKRAAAVESMTRQAAVDRFRVQDFGAVFAVDAMLLVGELELLGEGPEAVLSVPEAVALEHGAEALVAAARAVAERRPWPIVDVDAVEEVAGDEEDAGDEDEQDAGDDDLVEDEDEEEEEDLADEQDAAEPEVRR